MPDLPMQTETGSLKCSKGVLACKVLLFQRGFLP